MSKNVDVVGWRGVEGNVEGDGWVGEYGRSPEAERGEGEQEGRGLWLGGWQGGIEVGQKGLRLRVRES